MAKGRPRRSRRPRGPREEESLPYTDAIIIGAGIAGVSLAHRLVTAGNAGRVVLVDPLPALSLTSDKSTECYRNFWPGPDDAMVQLANASIEQLDRLVERQKRRVNTWCEW